MNEKNIIHKGIKKILFSMITQVFILICSLIMGFILPKYMGTKEYGYWQIYYFYLGYINLATLGFNDGIALRYSGMDEESIPRERIRSAIRILMQILIIIMILCIIIINLSGASGDMKYIYNFLALSLPCVCIMNIIVTIFLSLNKHIIYNGVNLANKIFNTFLFCLLIFLGLKQFEAIIISDFFIRILITVVCILIGKQFIFGNKDNFAAGVNEIKQNCSSGIFITGGALAASFIPMAGRVIIEHNETIETYGIFSFAMSLLGIIITFTNTAGTVFFPILKKLDSEKLPSYYTKLKEINNYILYIALLAYVPVVFIIQNYLTEYIPVLQYAYILFVMCIPLGKMQTVVTTYYKAFRMEKQYFIATLAGAIMMICSTFFVYKLCGTVMSVAITTTIIFTLWSYLIEIYLMRKSGVKINIYQILEEIVIMIIFITLAKSMKLSAFLIGYVFVLVVLTIFKRKTLLNLSKME